MDKNKLTLFAQMGARYVRCVQEKCPDISKEEAARYAARLLARYAQHVAKAHPGGFTGLGH